MFNQDNSSFQFTGLIWLFLLFWLVASLRRFFLIAHLWQLKEYRLDRLRVHLKTYQGKKQILPFLEILKLGLLIFFLFYYESRLNTWPLILGLAVFFPEATFLIRDVWQHQLKRPQFTFKIFLLFTANWFDIGCLWLWKPSSQYLINFLLLSNFLLPLKISLWIAILSLPTWLIKSIIIFRASRKIRKLRQLKVIGITGSYGKTSVKNFLRTVLESRFKVLATIDHQNTPLGIARQILRELNQEHQIYVVEMGAYKKGEIKKICQLVRPQIGMITGLGTQHLALFGSLEKLSEAKFELIQSLPKNGLAVFNGDSPACLSLSKKTTISTIIYSTKTRQVDFYSPKIEVFQRRIRFQVKAKKQLAMFEAKLLGRQNAVNLLGVIAVAFNLGLTFKEINQAMARITSLPRTMRLLSGFAGLKLVEDCYNSNPEGALAAIEYLKIFPLRKILIFQPMIELGKQTKKEHQRIIKKALPICDLIFLTNRNYYREVTASLDSRDLNKIILIQSVDMLLKLLFPYIKKTAVILFEGRETEKYLKILRKRGKNV